MFDVRDFGAVGDGVSDDWWAFQRALDAASEHRDGGIVVAPEAQSNGFWRISHALRLYSNVTMDVPNPKTQILSPEISKGQTRRARGACNIGM